MRRGKPALHKAFDEATAILAGDALISLAFEILADEATHNTVTTRLDLVAGLARASGMQGMVGGQMIDMMAARDTLDAGGLTRLQKMKTGALISFAVDAGAVLGGAEANERHALAGFAHDIGLAYQIADDVLDIEGDADILGKSVGKDAAQDKSTFVSLLGWSAHANRRCNCRIRRWVILTPSANVPTRCAKLPHLLFSGEADTNAPIQFEEPDDEPDPSS